ncbi:smoothelin, like [Erpetoichthys calabaricus]|uniref:Smoothelin, like n=1 Tax=Erpetoichthys calabaricus TaxID=27687 RepID=A0A8C4SAX7_ERPCA|nr:smoothelin, like [Erpetoichthys calabaricus]
MEANEIADLDQSDAQTVCEALGRYEDTLRDAVREIHMDINIFKKGVEQRIEDTLRLVSPLSRTVSELQQENRQLRMQLEALMRQVQLLTGAAAAERNGNTGSASPASPLSPTSPTSASLATVSSGGASATRYASRATFAIYSKTSSIDREEANEAESDSVSSMRVMANGHSFHPDNSRAQQDAASSSTSTSQEHTPSMATCKLHLPVSATTKASEQSGTMSSPESPISGINRTPERFHGETPPLSPLAKPEYLSQSATGLNQKESESSSQSVKVWDPSPIKTMGVSRVPDKPSSVSKLMSPSSYSPSGTDRAQDGHHNLTSKSQPSSSSSTSLQHQAEKRRELVRSQTLPRTMGAQARKAIFEKFDLDSNKPKSGDLKPKLKRSQSFGVSSASSIKQVLLDWCRSKTIGYKKIDIQNFSSSWNDGMAFCALVHSFFPEEFDYDELVPANHKQNFELAFTKAEERANCDRLIEVEDMLVMGQKPDPMCVFTYVQSLYNHLRKFE